MKRLNVLIVWEIEEISNINIPKDSVLCIGNFDGVHPGHMSVIDTGRKIAQDYGKEVSILSFLPHPRLIINPKNFFILTDLREKIKLLSTKVDNIIIINFLKIMNMEPTDFCNFIENYFRPYSICTGFDFSFGKNAKGKPSDLKSYFEKLGKKVEIIEKVSLAGEKISSSLLRRIITSGNISEYLEITGRPYQIRGIVTKGVGRGKTIGVPTANIITMYQLPPHGVYASFVKIEGAKEILPSVSNIGYQPTFNSFKETVETHIIDFDQNIYGQKITLMLIKKIRDVKKFANEHELKKQIQEDIKEAKSILK